MAAHLFDEPVRTGDASEEGVRVAGCEGGEVVEEHEVFPVRARDELRDCRATGICQGRGVYGVWGRLTDWRGVLEPFDPAAIAAHARQFSTDVFKAGMTRFIAESFADQA